MGLHTPRRSASSRSESSRTARRCGRLIEALIAATASGARLRRLHEGQRAAPVLRLHRQGHPGDRGGQPRQVRLLHARHRIPIVSEAEAAAMRPDYFLVLPWHFKDGILQREQAFLAAGGKMIFPLPEIEIVGG